MDTAINLQAFQRGWGAKIALWESLKATNPQKAEKLLEVITLLLSRIFAKISDGEIKCEGSEKWFITFVLDPLSKEMDMTLEREWFQIMVLKEATEQRITQLHSQLHELARQENDLHDSAAFEAHFPKEHKVLGVYMWEIEKLKACNHLIKWLKELG